MEILLPEQILPINADTSFPIVYKDSAGTQLDLHNYDIIMTFRYTSAKGQVAIIACTDHTLVDPVDTAAPYTTIQINPDGTGLITFPYSQMKLLQDKTGYYDTIIIPKATHVRDRAAGPDAYGEFTLDKGTTR